MQQKIGRRGKTGHIVAHLGTSPDERGVTATVFVVGKDATLASNHDALQAIVGEGHEIGNHSFMHEPWLHRYSDEAVATEIARSHAAISDASGQVPVGFRGPGFSVTPSVLQSLVANGYEYVGLAVNPSNGLQRSSVHSPVGTTFEARISMSSSRASAKRCSVPSAMAFSQTSHIDGR